MKNTTRTLSLILFVILSISDLPGYAQEPAGAGIFGAFRPSKEWFMPQDQAVLEKLREWQDRKLGLLITFGTYSQCGIVESWSMITTRHPWNNRPAEYAGLDDKSYVQAYENLITTFNPKGFDPDRWALAAREGGVKYVMVMSKHHDGFCMWDTRTTDYRITSLRCPFHNHPKADITRETVNSFRKLGMSTGIYFSKSDWHSPDYWAPELGPGSGQGPNFNPADRPEQWKRFKEFTWEQIRELMTGYGPQDVLWLDGGSVRPPGADIDMDGMAAMARKYQPGLIMVDRTVSGVNENYITPEGEIPEHYLPYPWETCMTMGDSWSYKPNDRYKSAGTLIRNLCRIVARNGNYLIGIGPDGNGEFDPTVYQRLGEMGEWLKLNGEAIYETRPIAPYEQEDCAFTTQADGTVYIIILPKDDDRTLPASITIPGTLLKNSENITLIGSSDIIPTEPAQNNQVRITIPAGIRQNPPCRHGWVLKVRKRG